MLLPRPAGAIHFPDIVDVQRDYQVAARKNGLPSDLFHKVSGDSNSLHLEWQGSHPISARYEQSREFDPDSFTVLTSEYGEGGTWHEWAGPASDTTARKAYPGLQQQWFLKGYGGEKGWLGSGVTRGRYFLVFRESSPATPVTVTGPLRLGPGLFAALDTSSQWLHVPCKDAGKSPKSSLKGGAKSTAFPVCFSPDEDARLRIRFERKSPLVMDIWLEEQESASLEEIRHALESVPDQAQAEYAKDLSQMLLGEAQIFLVKLSQRLPILFTWPSWQLQDFKGGQVPSAAYMDVVRRVRSPGDSLPAMRFQEKAGLRLDVDLYFRGMLHLHAEEAR